MASTNVSERRRVRVAPNLYRRGSGFELGYTGPDGRWHVIKLAARNKTEARQERDARLGPLKKGQQAGPSTHTFQEVADSFMLAFAGKVAAREKSQRTLDNYRYHLEKRVLPNLGPRRIDRITDRHIRSLVAEWQNDGLSGSTIHGTLVTIARVVALAVKEGHVPLNPVAKLDRDDRPSRRRRRDPRILSPAEIRRLLRAASPRYRTLLATALYSGLRTSELLGLTWGDIDFANGFIRVRAQLTRGTKTKPAVRVELLKTDAGWRDVILVPQLAQLLAQHSRETAYCQPNDFVFTTECGTPMHHRNVSGRGLGKAAKRAGLTDEGGQRLTMHSLRHAFISYLILELRLDPTRVARQVGHANASFTLDRYTHLFEQAQHADDVRERMAKSEFAALLDEAE